MDSFPPYMSGDAAYSISGRLSFPQLLLVTTYVFLRSCRPFRKGDNRQIWDIIRREERDWWPRIGSEGLSELMARNHEARDHRMDEEWEQIRCTLIKDHYCLPMSARDLRDQLRYIFNRLWQISAGGLSIMAAQAQCLSPPRTPLGSRGIVVLVCFSLIGIPSTSRPQIDWEPDDSTINDMVQHLHLSPLFPDGIASNELSTALSSLELLFSCEDDIVAVVQSRADTLGNLEDGIAAGEIHTWSYESYEVRQIHNAQMMAGDRIGSAFEMEERKDRGKRRKRIQAT